MDEYKQGQMKAAYKEGREGGVFNDEEERRMEGRKGGKEGEKADLQWALKMMSQEKREALKEEDLLRAKMQQAYKVREGGREGGRKAMQGCMMKTYVCLLSTNHPPSLLGRRSGDGEKNRTGADDRRGEGEGQVQVEKEGRRERGREGARGS